MFQLSEIRKHLGGRELLKDVSYHFTEGKKYAIYGPNGAGKSTLFQIITGQMEQDHGKLILPKESRIGYLRQEPNPNPQDTLVAEVMSAHEGLSQLERNLNTAVKKLEVSHDEKTLLAFERAEAAYRDAGGYELESNTKALLVGLGFTTQQFGIHPQSLSGGWRMRVELARTLIIEPNILVLDEPTNHLDLPSLIWFEKWLGSFKGTLIFVSHDKKLLEWLPDYVLHLRGGGLVGYKGNLTKFFEQREAETLQAESRFENLDKKKKQLEKFVEKFGAKASKAKQAGSKKKMIEKLEVEQEDIERPEQLKHLTIKLPEPPKNHRVACQFKGLKIGYTTPLTKPIQFILESGKKVAIVGANGKGKSTLLKTMAGIIPALGGEWSFSEPSVLKYFAQNQKDAFEMDLSVLENVCKACNCPENEARKALGSFLFSGDDVHKEFKVLSGGEKSRVGLCCAFFGRHNVLLLDEPTNHLDLISVEMLSQAIKAYKGTVFLVSHDRHLIESTCEDLLVYNADGSVEYVKGLHEWDLIF
jgi:ATP-binding cassette subfamily F protein 3